ncbi:MAG: hypothetical protein GX438_10710 [Treponema sp.]|nr:hypothetical protein [Treponema sp.]
MMNISYIKKNFNNVFKKNIFLIILLSIASNVFPQEFIQFANDLYKERDYFRAITEYKRSRFFSKDIDLNWICSVRIAESYWLSQKYESSLEYLFSIKDINDVRKKEWLLTTIALNYYGMKLFPNAKMYFNEAIEKNDLLSPMPYLYRSLLNMEGDNFNDARSDLLSIKNERWTYNSDQIEQTIDFASNTLQNIQSLPKKSPVLAASLSTLIPGLGQMYSGHWFDAIQAFTMIGSFALASYGVYLYEKANNGSYIYTGVLGAITLSFHLSNIYGAYKTAGFYNQKQKEDALQPLRNKIFSLPTLGETYYPLQ